MSFKKHSTRGDVSKVEAHHHNDNVLDIDDDDDDYDEDCANQVQNVENSSKEATKQMTKCYDEIDQIYDYIRGLAPLPSQLRKIKSIDFELLEKQQLEKQEKSTKVLALPRRKYPDFGPAKLHKSAGGYESTTATTLVGSPRSRVKSKQNDAPAAPLDLASTRGGSANDDDDCCGNSNLSLKNDPKQLKQSAYQRQSSSKPGGPTPMRLTTTTTVARKPLLKRVESLNLGAVGDLRRNAHVAAASVASSSSSASLSPTAVATASQRQQSTTTRPTRRGTLQCSSRDIALATNSKNLVDAANDSNANESILRKVTAARPSVNERPYKLSRAFSTSILNKNNAKMLDDSLDDAQKISSLSQHRNHTKQLRQQFIVDDKLPPALILPRRHSGQVPTGNQTNSLTKTLHFGSKQRLPSSRPERQQTYGYYPSAILASGLQIGQSKSRKASTTDVGTSQSTLRRPSYSQTVPMKTNFPPLPPLPDKVQVLNRPTEKMQPRHLMKNSHRRLTAIGIEQSSLDNARHPTRNNLEDKKLVHYNNDNNNHNSIDKIDPRSSSNFNPISIKAPLIDDDDDFDDELDRQQNDTSPAHRSTPTSSSPQSNSNSTLHSLSYSDDDGDDENDAVKNRLGASRGNSSRVVKTTRHEIDDRDDSSVDSNDNHRLMSNSEHIYEALDQERPHRRHLTRSSNSMSDLQSFSSNSYVSSSSPESSIDNERKMRTNRESHLKENISISRDKQSNFVPSRSFIKCYYKNNDTPIKMAKAISQNSEHSSRKNGLRKSNVLVTSNSSSLNKSWRNRKTPSDCRSQQSDLNKENNSSGVDLESSTLTNKHRSGKKSNEKLLNLIGLSPNASHSSSSHKSSAMSSSATRERRSDSGGSYQASRKRKPSNESGAKKDVITNYRQALTSPIASIFVAAASALKRTPTPSRDDINSTNNLSSSLSPKDSRFHSTVDYSGQNIALESRRIKHYKHPTVKVAHIPSARRTDVSDRNSYEKKIETLGSEKPKLSASTIRARNSGESSSTSSYEAAIKNSSQGLLTSNQPTIDERKRLHKSSAASDVRRQERKHRMSSNKLNSNNDRCQDNNYIGQKTLIKVPKLSRKSHLLKPITTSVVAYGKK